MCYCTICVVSISSTAASFARSIAPAPFVGRRDLFRGFLFGRFGFGLLCWLGLSLSLHGQQHLTAERGWQLNRTLAVAIFNKVCLSLVESTTGLS